MKKLLALAALALTAGAALAQTYSAQTVMDGGTNGTPAATTGTYSTGGYAMDVRKQQIIPILFSFKCGATNAGTVVLKFERSLDNSTYDATHVFTLTATANGTNVVTIATNLTLNGFGWVRLKTVANTNNVAGTTNMVLQYGIKQAN